jgi:amidase
VVERIERRGGIVIAKSNTPEFGAGGSTFNEVFGRTRNPWNTSLTCGGSTGGGAVALATGEVWLAHGSDHGGSLRRPAHLLFRRGAAPVGRAG